MKNKIAIGVDIGGTRIKTGVVNLDTGKILSYSVISKGCVVICFEKMNASVFHDDLYLLKSTPHNVCLQEQISSLTNINSKFLINSALNP